VHGLIPPGWEARLYGRQDACRYVRCEHHSKSPIPWLEIIPRLRHYARMSKVAQVEAELEKLSQTELRRVRDRLDDVIEDDLEFTPEFEASLQQSERAMKEVLRLHSL